jgi:hypothetical protein
MLCFVYSSESKVKLAKGHVAIMQSIYVENIIKIAN